MLFDQIWLGSYMSGGVGFTQYATAAYTDNILDDYTEYGVDYIKKKHGGIGKAKATQEVVSDIATEVNLYGMEQYRPTPRLSRATSVDPSVHPSLLQHQVSPVHWQRQTPTPA